MALSIEDFEAFAEPFPEPILLVSSSGILRVANPSARRTLPLPAVDASLLDHLADPPAKVLEYLELGARSGTSLPGAITFRDAGDGSTTYRCSARSVRLPGSQREALLMLRLAPKSEAVARFTFLNHQIEQLRSEIARRIEAQRDAHAQRELLRITLSSIGDAVIATDMQVRITFMNAVAETLTGWSVSEATGRLLDEVFVIRHETTGEAVESPAHKVLRTGQISSLSNHTVLVRRDGSATPIDDSGAPILDASGRPVGVVMVFHDVSERRALEQERARQAQALQEADRRKDQFLAVLAHELRNPLAPLRNGLQIARLTAQANEPLLRTVDMMERQLVHLVRLVNDLMDVSRVTRGVVELKRAPVALNDVLARSVESVRAQLDARRHELTLELPAEPIFVSGDVDRLTQVFSNLLANSIKYSEDGSSIRLRLASMEGAALIEVADSGIGIPPEDLERVFEMFSQVREHQGRSEGGLGIGLSLVRTLIELHGGTVTAHSDGLGRGSAFCVKLPALESSGAALQAAAGVRDAASVEALRILVADDNVDSAASMKTLLELAGHEVHTASDGLEALERAQHLEPHVIFMDIGMPGIDGLEAARRIRRLPNGSNMLIVALTGWGQRADRERTLDAGIDRHLVKPIGAVELERVLRAARKATT